MVYRAVGLMSGSSLDGLDIVFASFTEQGGQWTFAIEAAGCYPYTAAWTTRLREATGLPARDYLLLHSDYGHYLGEAVNRFIEENQLQFRVALIASHGHTSFHLPGQKMTAQLGDGAALAAVTGLPVVSDLRALDVALGGQGAPIVPVGERLLLGSYDYFLNIGGIANVSFNTDPYLAFDVCPANRVLNMLAADAGLDYDENGKLAASGTLQLQLLAQLNALDYYRQTGPRSLANDFGTDTVYPLVKAAGLSIPDALCTYCEHIAQQVARALENATKPAQLRDSYQLLCTGGGAFHHYLVERISALLQPLNISVVVPDEHLVQYKEALIMAFLGVLRWRQEYTVFSSVTGAARPSIGGALWTGQEA